MSPNNNCFLVCNIWIDSATVELMKQNVLTHHAHTLCMSDIANNSGS